MEYFRELFFTFIIFVIGYTIFKYDLFKAIIRAKTIKKDFTECYILKYPTYTEFHNRGLIYFIDLDEFFELNPKLKGKIKIIERPAFDNTSIEQVRNEVKARREIRKELNLEEYQEEFWEKPNSIRFS